MNYGLLYDNKLFDYIVVTFGKVQTYLPLMSFIRDSSDIKNLQASISS